jgi:hypothetical protein
MERLGRNVVYNSLEEMFAAITDENGVLHPYAVDPSELGAATLALLEGSDNTVYLNSLLSADK